MASIISAGTTSATALNMSADTSGVLQLSSNNGTVAATVDTSQRVGVGLTTLTERFEVNGAIGASTSSSNNFATGNARAFMDYVPGSNTARLGQLNGASGLTTGKLSLFNNGLESIAIDASGRIRMPYQPAFRAVTAGGSTSTTGVIAFATAPVNIGSHFSLVNNRFTAPVTGQYLFCANIYVVANNSSYGLIQFRVNGGQVAYSETQATATVVSLSFSIIVSLNAGDYADVAWSTASGRQYFAGAAETNFSGFLIG
jgi:hypothetical protein